VSNTAGRPIHRTTLHEKATGNHALDAYAYGPWPHLFSVLARKYNVPDAMLLTLLFLWDMTVGTGDDCGDAALTQIPIRARDRLKWLAAFVAAGFFKCEKATPGGADQRGSFYEYTNPTADDWDEFFRRAAAAYKFPGWDAVSTEQFATIFEDIRYEMADERLAKIAFMEILEPRPLPDPNKKP